MSTESLEISLYGQKIALLERTGGSWLLEFNRAYQHAVPRPILSQTFEDRDLRRPRQSRELFRFFRNLLPEGALRTMILKSEGLTDNDVALLARLGQDLPGAVTVKSTELSAPGVDPVPDRAGDERVATRKDGSLRFSLAGVQPKFSAHIAGDDRITVPASGLGGRWIVKLPTAHYPHLPEVEFSMMEWARQAGFEVPEVRLLDASMLSPEFPSFGSPSELIYACRRYDRTESDARLHQEDFAQVFDFGPEHKYEMDVVRLAQGMKRVLGDPLPFLRRLLFDLACGNGDAHLKNWSLLYREPHRPSMAPCYDLVATILYMPDDTPGLKYPDAPGFGQIDRRAFQTLLRQVASDTEATWADLSATATRIRDAWTRISPTLPLSETQRAVIEKHMDAVPLLIDLTTPGAVPPA